MAPKHPMSSRELLNCIGLNDENLGHLFDAEPLEDLRGDLGAALKERFQLINEAHCFKPGDLVMWKPGLKNHRFPGYGKPAVVLSILPEPIFDTEMEAGNTYFREPLDVILGILWERDPNRGDFVTFHFDSRRFQPWE